MEVTRKEVEKLLKKKYFIIDISIRPNGYIHFILEAEEEDPLEWHSFSTLAYYNDDDLWVYNHNGFHTQSLHGDYVGAPDNSYFILLTNGGVGRLSAPSGPEKDTPKIPPMGKSSPLFAKTLSDGKLYMTSHYRTVLRRDAPDQWTHLKGGLPSVAESIKEADNSNRKLGFQSMDSFAENNIYAGGGNGDLWQWNGKKWKVIDLPMNSYIDHVVCGGDGLVYISTDDGIIVGEKDKWEFADINDDLDIIVETMVWYKDRLYVATATQLYQIKDNHFSLSELDSHKNRPLYWRTLAVGAGVMVAGYLDSVVIYDGKDLTKILTLPNDIYS